LMHPFYAYIGFGLKPYIEPFLPVFTSTVQVAPAPSSQRLERLRYLSLWPLALKCKLKIDETVGSRQTVEVKIRVLE
jgi:hypothetical protein